MLSERNWRIESAGRMLIGLIVTTFCLTVLISSLRQATGGLSAETKTLLDMILGTLVFQGGAIIWTFIFLREEKLTPAAAFGFKTERFPRTVIFGVVVGICVVPIAWMLQMISVQFMDWFNLNPQSQELVKSFQQSSRTASEAGLLRQRIAFGISVIVLAPIAEEVLFRGIIYPTIKKFGFPRIALFASAILFALMHANIAGMIPLFFIGVMLVLVYEETDNLLAPILTHSIFNTANFLFMVYEGPINKFLFRS